MKKIAKDYADDPEVMHGKADDLVCELLKSLGYLEGLKIYEKMEKWYA